MAYMTKATAQLMRDLGSIQAPMNAFLLNLGLETLHLRMPQHCKNAQQVAEWLEANEQVAWVNFPGLKSNKYYELARKYMPNGTCGVIAFGLKGSREDAIRFMDNLKMICIVTHVADARTCVLHPASHTHRPDPFVCRHRKCKRHHRGYRAGVEITTIKCRFIGME